MPSNLVWLYREKSQIIITSGFRVKLFKWEILQELILQELSLVKFKINRYSVIYPLKRI